MTFSSDAAGSAPGCEKTMTPSRNAISVGIDEIWPAAASSGWSSVSTLPKVMSGCCSLAASKTGANIRHGPHQDAHQSTRVIPGPVTVSAKESLVSATVLIFSSFVVLGALIPLGRITRSGPPHSRPAAAEGFPAPTAVIPAHALAFEAMGEPAARTGTRLAELLAVLSLGTDLGMGQPMEHVLRQCLISMRLAELMGLGQADREVVYYTSLIAWVGCHVDAYEQAKWFGDDNALKADFRHVDLGSPLARPLFMLRHLGAGRPAAERARLGVGFLGDGRRAAESMLDNHWIAADGLASRLGLSQQVRDSVEQTFERWDGKGVPKGAKGTQIHVHAR